MIYKLSKDKCYSINGKLILNNRYTKVEGNVFDSQYAQNNLASDTATLNSESLGETVTDSKTYAFQGPMLITYYKWQYRIYYKSVNLGVLSSTEIMDKNISSFITRVTPSGDSSAQRIASYGVGMPAITINFPTGTIHSDGREFIAKAKEYLGICNVYYSGITSFTVTPTIYVISKIEIYYSNNSAASNPTWNLNGTVAINDDVNYQVFSTNFMQESSNFSYGEDNSLLTYKLSDNELFDANAEYVENSVSSALIVKVAQTILSNYKKGKQVVTIECPTLNLANIDGKIDNNHIFEIGECFYIEDEIGNSLFYYKLTNIPKIFELISAEYIKETWTLILKEVARNESN